jgi:hypothetical protein
MPILDGWDYLGKAEARAIFDASTTRHVPEGSVMEYARSLLAVSLALAVTATSACTYKPRTEPPNTGPTSVTQARKYLEGRWTLVSFMVYPPSGSPIEIKGSGTLNYDDYGNLTMELVVDEASAALMQKAGIPVEKGRFSSKGRTIVDMQGRSLTYMLEGQPAAGAPAGPLALNRPRYWQVDGNVLTLTTKDDKGQPLSVGKWQKQ